jgi:6-phosphogluconolactonase/glucosamine-6-phosphate isomerase/deaminase
MRFVKVDSPEPVVAELVKVILGELAGGKHVLWLLSGGSAIDIAVQARQKLPEKCGKLTAMLMDERYGSPGHPDSNWQQLLDAGFNTEGIDSRPTLRGEDFAQTARDFNKMLRAAFNAADTTVGLFGIGPDGHTAGILPGSPALSSRDLTAAYKGPDYERITMTFAAFDKVDVAMAYVVGPEKTAALKHLQKDLPVEQQPSQALKRINKVTIFNDVMEGTV